MLAGERLYRDADRLSAIADLTYEPGREECQAKQPGYLRLVDTFKACPTR